MQETTSGDCTTYSDEPLEIWKEPNRKQTCKKRKTIDSHSTAGMSNTPGTPNNTNKWLVDLPLRNSYSSLADITDNVNTSEPTPQVQSQTTKPPPIYMEAKIIEPLIELLNLIVNIDSYTIKQIKENQIRIQLSTPDEYRKVTQELKKKDAAFYTYQLKSERAYKIVVRGLHPAVDKDKIVAEINALGHSVKTITNITHRTTKAPLPLFTVELEPRFNNHEIFRIKKLHGLQVNIETPRPKRDVPQCTRCQAYGHTHNYCHRTPACVKYAQSHLTKDCPIVGKVPKVLCANCGGEHPASYKGCKVRKDLLNKLYPQTREKKTITTAEKSFTNYKSSPPDHTTDLKQSYANALKTLNSTPNTGNSQSSFYDHISTQFNTLTTNMEKILETIREQNKQINTLLQLLINILSKN